MKGFKNSTRTQYFSGGPVNGMPVQAAVPAAMPAQASPVAAIARSAPGARGMEQAAANAAAVRQNPAANPVSTMPVKVAMKKGGSVKGAAKISKVMGEFKAGKLHSGSKEGPEVTSKKQATAIALSEARKAGAKVAKKSDGGRMSREGVSTKPVNPRTGKPATEAEMRQRQRDFGDMSDAEIRDLLGRGERASALEAGERALIRKPARGPAGAGYNSKPLVRAKGGLAVMPRGKKC
jgi:hypothetical protein